MALLDATVDFAVPASEVEEHAARYAAHFEVYYEVLVLRGESGWPVVRFIGELARLDRLLTHYHAGTDREESLR